MTTLPSSPVNRPRSCSHQASSLCPPALVRQFASVFLMCLGDLELDALFEDHGASWTVIEEVYALERAVYQRCFPAQLPLSDRQRFNRKKCARLVQDLGAAAALPPHSAHFPLPLLDLAHVLSDCRSLHYYQNGSRAGPGSTACPPTSRFACGNRKTLHQAAAPQRTVAAHCVDKSANCYCKFSHPGSSKLRGCNSHASSLDRNLRTAPFSLARTATPTVASPAYSACATHRARWRCASHCRGLRSRPSLH